MEYKRPRYYKLKELGYKKVGGSTKWCKVMEENYYLMIDAETFEHNVLCEKKFNVDGKVSKYLKQVEKDARIVSIPEKNYEELYADGWTSVQVGCEMMFSKWPGKKLYGITEKIKFDKFGRIEQSWVEIAEEGCEVITEEQADEFASIHKNLKETVRNLMINLEEGQMILDINEKDTMEFKEHD